MKNIAIIPARSGSKGLVDKNIRKLNGIPMLVYSIRVAIESGMFDEIMVSTDSKKYADIAIENGANVPFLRSDYTSSDVAGSWDVVKEVLDNYKTGGDIFNSVCLLQPTSPLRKVQDILDAYKLMEEKKANAVTAVCECEHSPLWSTVLPQDKSLDDFRKKNSSFVPRQKLEKYYRINGAIYIRRINSDNGLLERPEYAYIMNRNNSVDVDTINDFEYAEFLIKKNNR